MSSTKAFNVTLGVAAALGWLSFCQVVCAGDFTLGAEFTGKERYAIFNPHEPVAVRLKLNGRRLAEDRLLWCLQDYRERIVEQGTLPVPPGDTDWEQTLRLGDRPAGYFELHLRFEKSGVTIPRLGSRPPGFVAFAVLPEIAPLALPHPDDSRFGIQGKCFVDSGRAGEGDPFGPIYGLLGVRWLYDYLEQPWLLLPAWVEKTGPNTFRPTLDAKVFLEQKKFEMKNCLSVLFDLHSVPPWLMNLPPGKTIPPDKVVPSHNCQDYPPEDWEYYGGLLKRLASDKAILRRACFPNMRRSYYQIHWEPNGYWKGTDEEFIRMYQVAAKAIKDVDPDAFLLGPNYGVIADGNQRLERLFPKGLGQYLDGVLTHSYILAYNGENGVAPEEGGLVNDARKLMRLVRQYLPPGAPVYNTEGSCQNNGFDPALSHWILRRQAGWLLRHHLICLGEGFTSTWFFLLTDNDAGASGYGLLYNLAFPQVVYESPRVAPKPVFAATAAATRLLEGTRSLGPIDYLGDHVLGYGFDRDGQVLVALWSTDDQEREVILPVGSPVVTLYDPMGNPRVLKTPTAEARVKIDGNPIYLLGLTKEAFPEVAAVPLEGRPGESLALKPPSAALPQNARYLFRRDKTTLAGHGVSPTIPLKAPPGVWLLQMFAGRKLVGSRTVTVKPPVDLQPSGVRISGRRFDLTIANKLTSALTGRLRVRGKEGGRELGRLRLGPGTKQNIELDVVALHLLSPARRFLTVEFEDQNGVVSTSPAIGCNLSFASRTTAAPPIDVDLRKWDKVEFHQISGEDALVIRNPEKPWAGDDDLSFRFAFQYDDQALYLALKVRDQSHVQRHPYDDSWQQDSVQVGLATDGDGAQWNSWQKLCLALGNDGICSVRRNNGTNLPAEEISKQVIPRAFRRIDGETWYELALPWKEIDPRWNGIPPQRKLGVGILVNDVDETVVHPPSGPAVTATSKRQAMEAFGGMFWGKPEQFGVLVLTEDKP